MSDSSLTATYNLIMNSIGIESLFQWRTYQTYI